VKAMTAFTLCTDPRVRVNVAVAFTELDYQGHSRVHTDTRASVWIIRAYAYLRAVDRARIRE